MVLTFRVAGMSSDEPPDLDRFTELVKTLLPEKLHRQLEILKLPAEAPHTVVVYLKDLTPPVNVYNNFEGSTLIVDGEIVSEDYRKQGPIVPVAFQELLARLAINPEQVLDGLDAAAFMTFFNGRDRRVYVARDAIGNVPGYYRTDARQLIWSSDLATLMALERNWDFNDECVDFFLAAGYVPSPWTFVKGIWKLEPGHAVMRARREEPVQKRYIDYRVQPREELPQSQVISRLSELFPKAVARRATESRKTGVLLSGGVDSQTVLATLVAQSGSLPDTFTFLYEGYEGAFNEGKTARRCAEYFGARHHEIPVDPSSLPGMASELLTVFGEPFSYGLHTVMLDQVREHGVRELLCGTGADGAWFLGTQQIGAIKFLGLPWPVRVLAAAGVNTAQATLNAVKSAGYFRDIPAAKFHRSVWSAQTGFPGLLADNITPFYYRRHLHADEKLAERGQQAANQLFDRALADVEELDLHQRYRVLQTRFYGADMMQNWNHWSGRGHDLDIRAPYYDREALDFMLSQPFMRNDKIELREYAATMMPREMSYAPKLPQSVPIIPWMHGPLKEWVHDVLTPARLARFGHFKSASVQKLLADFYADRSLPRGKAWTIWNIMMVTMWHENQSIGGGAASGGV